MAQYSANEWGGVEVRLLKEVGNSLNFGYVDFNSSIINQFALLLLMKDIKIKKYF